MRRLYGVVMAAACAVLVAACGNSYKGHPLKEGAVILTVQWPVGTEPQTGFCFGSVSYNLKPASLNQGTGKGQEFSAPWAFHGVRVITSPGGKKPTALSPPGPSGTKVCVLHRPAISGLR